MKPWKVILSTFPCTDNYNQGFLKDVSPPYSFKIFNDGHPINFWSSSVHPPRRSSLHLVCFCCNWSPFLVLFRLNTSSSCPFYTYQCVEAAFTSGTARSIPTALSGHYCPPALRMDSTHVTTKDGMGAHWNRKYYSRIPLDLRKKFFTVRIIVQWKNLPGTW